MAAERVEQDVGQGIVWRMPAEIVPDLGRGWVNYDL